ncbi:zinc-binding domain-containing protein [Aspergillus crustosus]
MARKKKTFYMYPDLDPLVTDLLESTNPELPEFAFHSEDNDHTCDKHKVTSIMGTFACHNPTCQNFVWASKKIAVTIRLYGDDGYNARVYAQRCRDCNALSKPRLNQKCYAERVVYWLKKWSGVSVAEPGFVRKKKKPHEKMFCEGCKAGRCNG